MAGKRKGPAPKPKRRHWGRRIALAVLAAALGFAGWMHLNARIVHVRYAEVRLGDLPASFDGTTVLFVSDVDLCGSNTAGTSASLFRRLQALQPDLLLLGGDYASPSLLQLLNGRSGDELSDERMAFFQSIAGFQAPLGKYAVSGDHDGDTNALKLAALSCGVTLIDGDAAVISNGTDAIAVAGAVSGDVSSLAQRFLKDQFVIALTHSPSQAVDVRICEASDGGAWADLVLSGHTHAGQVQVGGHSVLELDEADRRYLSGWFVDGPAPLLVTSGAGCEGANFRLGTQSEVWLITLHTRPEME